MPEYMTENLETRYVGDEIHPGETVEEKISLSERFGLWVSFYPFDQDEYLAMVFAYADHFGLEGERERIRELVASRVAERVGEEGLGVAVAEEHRDGQPAPVQLLPDLADEAFGAHRLVDRAPVHAARGARNDREAGGHGFDRARGHSGIEANRHS